MRRVVLHLAPALGFTLLASCQASIGGDPDRGELLNALASSSARAFADPAVREELFAAFLRPEVREGKLHLSEIVAGGDLAGSIRLDNLRASLVTEGADFPALLSAFPEDIEMYIPIPEQRASFTPDKEVIFVVADPELEESDADLEAYDMDGNKLFLPRDVLPSVTAIVVTPAEPKGQSGLVAEPLRWVPEPGDEDGPRYDLTVRSVATPRSAAEACNGREHQDGDAHILADFMIRNTHEPWFFGAPEIQLLMAFPQELQARFELDGGEFDVNEPNQIYTVERPLFRWDRSLFAQDILFRVIEKDGGFSMDIDVKATVPLPYGVGFADVNFKTTIQNMDDDMGIQFVRFDDPCGALYSTGSADWHLYYSPE